MRLTRTMIAILTAMIALSGLMPAHAAQDGAPSDSDDPEGVEYGIGRSWSGEVMPSGSVVATITGVPYVAIHIAQVLSFDSADNAAQAYDVLSSDFPEIFPGVGPMDQELEGDQSASFYGMVDAGAGFDTPVSAVMAQEGASIVSVVGIVVAADGDPDTTYGDELVDALQSSVVELFDHIVTTPAGDGEPVEGDDGIWSGGLWDRLPPADVHPFPSTEVVEVEDDVVFTSADEESAPAADGDEQASSENASAQGNAGAGAPVERWRFETGSYVTASAAVADGVVYIGSDDGHLYAIDASDGSELWSFEAEGAVKSPAVADGVVYVGSSDGHLYAIDVNDGAERWRFQAGDSVRSPVVADGVVYVGSVDSHLYAISVADGAELWRFKTGDRVLASPIMVDGVVYVGSYDHNLYAIDANGGTELWRFETGEVLSSSPVVVDGVVYVGSYDYSVYAINARDGAEIWRFDTGYYVDSSPAVVDGVIYIGSNSDNLYAIDASDGSELWSFAAGDAVNSSPVVVDGVVYVGSSNGNLYAVDAGDGAEDWRFATGGPVNSPTVVDGVVYVGSWDDNLYAIEVPPTP